MGRASHYLPLRLDPARAKHRSTLQRLRTQTHVRIVDEYVAALDELCVIRHPTLRGNPRILAARQKAFRRDICGGKAEHECGLWVFFPLHQTLVHYLEESLHHELRTARNHHLITKEEQAAWYAFPVAIAGLSVGSHAAVSIALQGGGREMRLADPDRIAGSNLNRIRVGFDMAGSPKTAVVADEVFRMNPYAALRLYPRGITPKTIDAFLTKPRRVGVLIEETDDIALKLLIRRRARALEIPVIMAADNGDGIILDVERYDREPSLPILYGRGDGITMRALRRATPETLATIITNLIDPAAVTPRMRSSVAEVGRTLYSWPQLGGAAQLAGVVLAYAARMIATGGPLESGRTIISLEQLVSHQSFSV